jgi:hcpE
MKKILVFAAAVFALNAFASENYDKANELYVKKNFEEAYLYFNKACGEGEKRACTMNAIMLFNGDGVAKDRVQAEKIFTKMCDANEGMACGKIGEKTAYGLIKGKDDNEAKSEEKAKALFKKACDNGYKPACDFVTK